MLNLEEIESLLSLNWSGDRRTFTRRYQDGKVPEGEYLTFNEVRQAYRNTCSLVGQAELSTPRVVNLAEAIFRIDRRLIEDLTIHQIEGKYYLVGGRHRLFAVLNVFGEMAEHSEGVSVDTLCEQFVRVRFIIKPNLSNLIDDVRANNGSRNLLKAEELGYKAQREGALAKDPLSFVKPVLKEGDGSAEMTDNAGLYFVWAFKKSKLSDKQRHLVGKVLAKYILFGKMRLSSNSQLVVTTTSEFDVIAKELWAEVEDIVADRDILAKQAQQVALDAIARYKKNAA